MAQERVRTIGMQRAAFAVMASAAILAPQASGASEPCSCADRTAIDWRIKEIDFLIKGFSAEKARISPTEKFTNASYVAFSHGPLQKSLNAYKSSATDKTTTWAARTDPASCRTELPDAATPCLRAALDIHEKRHRTVCESRQNVARTVAFVDYRSEQTLAAVYQEEIEAYSDERKALEGFRARLPGGGEPVLIYEVMLRGNGEGGYTRWRVNRRFDGRAVLDNKAPLASGLASIPQPPRGATVQQMQQYAQAMTQAMNSGTSWIWLPVSKSGVMKGGEPMHVSIEDEFVSRSQDVCTKEWTTTTTTYKGDGVDRNEGDFQYHEDRANARYNVEINLRAKGSQSYTQSTRTETGGKTTSAAPVQVPFSRVNWMEIPDSVVSQKIKHAKWQPLPADPKIIRFDTGWVTPKNAAATNWPGADKNLKMRAYYQVTQCK